MGAVKGHRRDAWWAAAACAVAALAYVPLASPYVQGGDVGEFATLFAKGGVAHPPGYPLFTLILRAFAWIPARSAAHGAALVTAAIQIGAVAMLARACRSWGASAQAAGLASLAYALSGSAWGLATHAEVFALNALIAAAIADAAGPHARVTGWPRVVLLGLLAGLGLSHHTTILAMGPIGLVGVVRGFRETGDRVRASVYGVLAFAAGLTPYAYTLWRSHDGHGWVWGDPMRFSDLVRHVRRTEYWEIAASDGRGAVSFDAHLRAFAEHLARDLVWLLVPVVLVGVVVLFARARRDRRVPVDAVALVASFALAGPVFLFLMSRGIGNVPMSVLGVSGRIVERFYLMPLLLACVPLAFGFDAMLARAARARPVISAVGALAIALAGLFVARPRVVEDGRAIVETYLVDTLQSLPPNAILVGTGDHRTFGFLYVQEVLDVRRDVLWIDAHLARTDWYRARVRHGSLLPPPPREATALVAHLASGDRPLFLTNDVDIETRSTLPTYAIGTVIRVFPRASPALPHAIDLEKLHDGFAPHLHRARTPPRDRWGWAADADEAYARGWLDLAGRFQSEGDRERANACMVRANARP